MPPSIVSTASTRGTGMCVLIIPTNTHWAVSWAVHVLRLVSTAGSRTESLCILLPVFINLRSCTCIGRCTISSHHCYPPASQRNEHRPRLVAILKRAMKKLIAVASNRLKLDVDVFLCCIDLLQFAYNAFSCILGVLIAQLWRGNLEHVNCSNPLGFCCHGNRSICDTCSITWAVLHYRASNTVMWSKYGTK